MQILAVRSDVTWQFNTIKIANLLSQQFTVLFVILQYIVQVG